MPLFCAAVLPCVRPRTWHASRLMRNFRRRSRARKRKGRRCGLKTLALAARRLVEMKSKTRHLPPPNLCQTRAGESIIIVHTLDTDGKSRPKNDPSFSSRRLSDDGKKTTSREMGGRRKVDIPSLPFSGLGLPTKRPLPDRLRLKAPRFRINILVSGRLALFYS